MDDKLNKPQPWVCKFCGANLRKIGAVVRSPHWICAACKALHNTLKPPSTTSRAWKECDE